MYLLMLLMSIFLASKDTANNKTSTESGSMSASVTFGAGLSVDVNLSRNEQTGNSTTFNNSTINGNNITITSTQDTNIKGANVNAANELNMEVGGDLTVASVQDRHNSSNKGAGISAGLSLSGEGDTTGASGGYNSSNGRTNSKETILTSLTSNGTANIKVGGNTDVRGALIATVDENGEDLGNLTLETETFSYVDLSNRSYDQNQSIGVSSSVGVQEGELDATNNTTSVQYENGSTVGLGKTLATIGGGNLVIANTQGSTDTSRLNRDVTNTEKDLFEVDRQQGDIDVAIDHRLLTEDGREQIDKDFSDAGTNMQKIDDVLPSAQNDNEVLAALGSVLDTVGMLTGGILPSDENLGGIFAQLPVLMGQHDDSQKVIQVASSIPKGREGEFIKIEDSDYFKTASEDEQKKLKGYYVTTGPVTITEGTSTYQNSTNGMLNTEMQALINGVTQTHATVVNNEGRLTVEGENSVLLSVNYNPTRGILSDGLESAVDKYGGTTGMAEQTGEFIRDVTTANGTAGTNIANHSQGNLLTLSGMKYINEKGSYESGGFKGNDHFVTENEDGLLNDKAIPSVGGFGSPVNTNDMREVVEKGAEFSFNGNYTNDGDFVGEVLGRNKGKDGDRGNSQLSDAVVADSYIKLYKLFTEESPHSGYNCTDLSPGKCGAKLGD